MIPDENTAELSRLSNIYMVRFFFTVVSDRLVKGRLFKGRQVRGRVVHPVISVTLRTAKKSVFACNGSMLVLLTCGTGLSIQMQVCPSETGH